MGEPAVPSLNERREAVELANQLLDLIRRDEAFFPLDDRRVWLLAATLVHARAAFERMTPVYLAALAFVRDDGTQDATRWERFKQAVLAVKAELAKEKKSDGT